MAVKYDDRTAKGWPLPHRENRLYDDVERLREALNLVDEALTAIETHEGTIEGRQDSIDTRLDVILEGATEDSEILDARVDAEDTVHPNLGHNIRNLHRLIRELDETLKFEDSELRGLARQFGSLSEAQILYELDGQEAHKRRKQEIKQEASTRLQQDDGLQAQINSLAESSMLDILNLDEAIGRRKSDLNQETEARKAKDKELQSQISENARSIQQEAETRINAEAQERSQEDLRLARQVEANAEGNIRNALNIQQVSKRRKADLAREAQSRIDDDKYLQSQIDSASQASIDNALNISDEATERRKVREALDAEIQERSEHDAQQDERISLNARDIEAEAQERSQEDLRLARQVEANAEGNIRNALNIQQVSKRRKADLAREAQSRIDDDKYLQSQIDRASQASIDNALNISDEATERRKVREALDAEIQERSEHDAQQDERISLNARDIEAEAQERAQEDLRLARQVQANAEGNIRNALNIQEVSRRRKADLAREAQSRIDDDKYLQSQIDRASQASIDNALNLSDEAEQRRKSDALIEALNLEAARLNEADSCIQRQLDAAVLAILRNILTLREALSRNRKALQREKLSRIEDDCDILAQINTNSEAEIENTLNLQSEAKQRRNTDNSLQVQINELILHISENMSYLLDVGAALQEQNNSNAIAALELAVNLSDEAEKRRALEHVIEGLDSPADWSRADSIAIPEPRCAVVNISGINAMPTSKTVELAAMMEFWDMQGNYFRKKILCAAQGNSSMRFVKKNVKFDLLNEDGSEFELKIGDWVSQDGFHLKAYYTDYFRGIAVTSYKFWNDIMRFNGTDKDRPYKKALGVTEGVTPTGSVIQDTELQLETGALCHPDGFPCIVYLNGEFYGIFSWQIKKQRKNYHMDKSTVEHIHLDGELYVNNFWNGVINWTLFEIRNPNKLYTMDGKKYDGDAPKELIDETSEKYDPDNKDHKRTAQVKKYIQDFVAGFVELKQLYTAYRANPGDETLSAVKSKYEELFDWENQRDYLIFSDIINNIDGFRINWQWTTYDGVKWWVNAYDLDMSFGGDWLGRYITPPITGHITTSTALPTYYAALLYKTEIETRYKELRDAGIIETEHILAYLRDWVSRIGTGNYELEYEKWPNSPCIINYTDSIYRVKKWLDTSIANMDSLYGYSPESGIQSLIAETASREAFEAEVRSRVQNDDGLQEQINQLAIASMWLNVREHETRQKMKEIEITAESIPGRAATDEEFDEMLDKLYDKP